MAFLDLVEPLGDEAPDVFAWGSAPFSDVEDPSPSCEPNSNVKVSNGRSAGKGRGSDVGEDVRLYTAPGRASSIDPWGALGQRAVSG